MKKKRTTFFEDDEAFTVGREIGFQDLLRIQMFWINKAIALSDNRSVINLVYGLESMLLPYSDKEYEESLKEIIKKNGTSNKIRISKEKYRTLIALMDRRGFLIEKAKIDEI